MSSSEPYIGQRRSYAGALCTVRYIGPLSNTAGDWLGVEWDDASRGKHDGQYEGKRIFQYLSSSATAASFVRPSRKDDPERTLLEAIKFKYAASNDPARSSGSGDATEGTIEISGKVVEEVGFDKIKKQLSILSDLKIVLVDELVVSGIAPRGASREDIQAAQIELARTCPNIVELELGWNIIETWQDIVDSSAPFKKLKILKASGLRLRGFEANPLDGEASQFRTLQELHMNECLLTPAQILQVLSSAGLHGFSSLKTLSLSSNELETVDDINANQEFAYPSVTAVVLDNNRFTNLSSLPTLTALFPNTSTLSFQGNAISHLGLGPATETGPRRFEQVETLNLAGNQISDYSFVDALATMFPNLTSLRISRNPLFAQAEPSTVDAQNSRAASLSDSTSYYLTLARIPHLKSLNYTAITPRDREEGEIYYLSVAEKEIKPILESRDSNDSSLLPDQRVNLARQRHPLYSTLCAKHDRDDVIDRFLQISKQTPETTSTPARSALEDYAPGTLGSRLVDTYFYIHRTGPQEDVTSTPTLTSTIQSSSFRRPLPITVSVYRLKSLLAKQLNLPALQFRLIYESHEYDPVEPISRTTAMGGGKEDWEAWGDWDVDDDDDLAGSAQEPIGAEDRASAVDGKQGRPEPRSQTATAPPNLDVYTDSAPKYITRDGQRFKKRETEILDGMRPWGDFLDLDGPDGSRRRDARVRIEPLSSFPTGQGRQ
ncbi:hypothetical protein A1O3_05742 [Capronia epimyces CBS 606.96]|uniref:CAP-Gly domain-containing protein n=1 Tax=Capronia epimyces CBS 606.96 TaxID=1182542 RepID=W9XWX3_9EURO|nr:uncharacterized protein A1O3_05742 [Capronia epimyces CBS 606.96]EXJ85067.1 hypothetical protein A1O3_05742 [Capronia epimyces CBS 606.96]